MRIGLVHNWPGSKNSEFDLIGRIRLVLGKLGHDSVVIDSFGNVLDPKTGKHFDEGRPLLGDLDFYINLHYLNPKLVDSISYVVNWNPLDYLIFNPTDGSEVQHAHLEYIHKCAISHDYMLSASSEQIDEFQRSQFCCSRWAPEMDELRLHTTCQIVEDIPPVQLDKFKVFYIGANWERMALGTTNPNAKVRHEGLLEKLDKTGDFVFYGLRKQQGIFLWEGFRNYKGELPFDAGESIVRICNESGVAIVLSSNAHRSSKVVSTRIFQACAARAVIISDDNPFILKYFGDSVLTFKYTEDIETTFLNILEQVIWIKRNPELAAEKAEKSHQIFKQKFSLNVEIERLVDGHTQNLQATINRFKPILDYCVDVYFICAKHQVSHIPSFAKQVVAQKHVNVRGILVVPGQIEVIANGMLKSENKGSCEFEVVSYPDFEQKTRGCMFLKSFEEIGEGNFFAFWNPDIYWHSCHTANLLYESYQSGVQIVQAATYVKNDWYSSKSIDGYFAMHSINAVKRLNLHALLMLEIDKYQPAAFLFCSKLLLNNWDVCKAASHIDTGFYFHFLLLLYISEQQLPAYVPKLTCEYTMPEGISLSGQSYPQAHDFRIRLYDSHGKYSKSLEASILLNAISHHPEFWKAFSLTMEIKQSLLNMKWDDKKNVARFSLDEYMRGAFTHRPFLLRIWGACFNLMKKFLRLS